MAFNGLALLGLAFYFRCVYLFAQWRVRKYREAQEREAKRTWDACLLK
jgi:hypothetical protein